MNRITLRQVWHAGAVVYVFLSIGMVLVLRGSESTNPRGYALSPDIGSDAVSEWLRISNGEDRVVTSRKPAILFIENQSSHLPVQWRGVLSDLARENPEIEFLIVTDIEGNLNGVTRIALEEVPSWARDESGAGTYFVIDYDGFIRYRGFFNDPDFYALKAWSNSLKGITNGIIQLDSPLSQELANSVLLSDSDLRTRIESGEKVSLVFVKDVCTTCQGLIWLKNTVQELQENSRTAFILLPSFYSVRDQENLLAQIPGNALALVLTEQQYVNLISAQQSGLLHSPSFIADLDATSKVVKIYSSF